MKYKYYFKKPTSEIVKDILKWITVSSLIYIAASSPYFTLNLMRKLKKWQKYKKRNVYEAFRRLQKQGCIKIEKRNKQFYIKLTEKGKKMAGWLQIDELKIKRPKKWDAKWRIVIFDISQMKKIHRELLRGKLKELGFYLLQKSVWVHAFDCKDEIEVLKSFFGLNQKEIRLIVAQDIGFDEYLRKFFEI